MEDPYLISTATLLLIAGHETTVNLLGNGLLTLLRFPAILDRLRNQADLVPAAVEEMLRYEPPVQLLPIRTTPDDVRVVLVLAVVLPEAHWADLVAAPFPKGLAAATRAAIRPLVAGWHVDRVLGDALNVPLEPLPAMLQFLR